MEAAAQQKAAEKSEKWASADAWNLGALWFKGEVYGAGGLASELAGYMDDFEPIPERVSYVWEQASG